MPSRGRTQSSVRSWTPTYSTGHSHTRGVERVVASACADKFPPAVAESLQQLVDSMPPEFTQVNRHHLSACLPPHPVPSSTTATTTNPAPHSAHALADRSSILRGFARGQGVLRVRDKLQREAEQVCSPLSRALLLLGRNNRALVAMAGAAAASSGVPAGAMSVWW